LKVTHQELADHIGTSREVISRILKDWEDRGSVALARGPIRLLPGFRELQVSPALTRRR
jgi:CRP/FNR family transcriptional regulator